MIKRIDINGRIRKLKIVDHVLVKNEVRGTNKWICGKIVKVLGSRCYLVQGPGHRIMRHIDQLIINNENDHDHENDNNEVTNS